MAYMRKYRFSPSLLDEYQKLLDTEAEFESDYNFTNEGPKRSLEEIREERERELLDAINHEQQEPSQAASMGTAFNEIVDQIIRYKYWDSDLKENVDKSGRVTVEYLGEETITCSCDGFKFAFDRRLVERVASIVWDGTMQLHVEAPLQVTQGTQVILHGFPDYIQPRQVTDLKTTSSYAFGKYERYWQRYAYPYILQKAGLMQGCDAFEFLVVEMSTSKNTGVTGGQVYRETYTDASLETCEENLRWICSCLVDWVEAHREQITYNKIFN